MAVSLVDLFDGTVRRHRHRPALAVAGGESLSYADVDRRSAQVANALCAVGVQRGDRVGLLLPKSVESVIGLWGILRAGAAYVPIDPAAPPARAAYIAGNASVAAVVASSELGESVRAIAETVGNVRVLDFHGSEEIRSSDAVPRSMIDGQSDSAPRRAVNVRDLAYILYTSGSTGTPKGVMLSHGAALSFIEWAATRFELQMDDILSNHAPFHFDISTFDVFGAVYAGAKLVILDDETVRFPIAAAEAMQRERISVWYSVPRALREMLKWGRLGRRDLRALRTVLFAGEVYPTDELRALQGALPNVALYNLYGPTETNVCTYWKVPPLDSSRDAAIPIGFDCESCQGVVVDDELRVVGDDTEGELLVRGGTLMSGYWGDLQRTKAALIPDFLYPHLGDYFYRTGDIVRRRLDGSYTFLGRRDHQVKVRGYRVELGEVEVALRRIDSLADAAVVAVERQGGQETELVAFTVACGDFAHDPDEATLQLERRLAAFLPKYMIPSEIRWVRNLPTTSTGKVDREALSTIARGGVGDATASQAAHSDIMQPSRW